MLLDSCLESYPPYPTPDQYYYSQASCPPSPVSHPPSPSIYAPSPSLYSPCSNNYFQFPTVPYPDVSSTTIKEEPFQWRTPSLEQPSISSPSHTPTFNSRSPLLSQAATHFGTQSASSSSHTVSHVPNRIRSSHSSIHSYSNAPYYFSNQMAGTFGHSLASFHHNSSSNMEVISSSQCFNISPPGSGYSTPATDLSTDVFHPASQYEQFIPNMYAQKESSSSPPSPSISPQLPGYGVNANSSIKEETSEEELTVKCKWGECGKEYGDKYSLVEHINTNHIEHKKGCEDYPCHWMSCPRRWKPFNAKYKLLTHIRVHTGEKPFCCKKDGCTRSFARLENLKIHNRSHTGEKPFLCKYHCSKAFSNSSDRAKHEQTHKDPKPYRCEVFGCQKKYTDPSSLRKHVKNHTKEEQEQVKQKTRDSSKIRSITNSPEGWLEVEQLHGNQPLLSGGGIVRTEVDTLASHYKTEECHGYGVGCWGRRMEDGGELYSEQWKRKEEEDRINFYNTPLYLEV